MWWCAVCVVAVCVGGGQGRRWQGAALGAALGGWMGERLGLGPPLGAAPAAGTGAAPSCRCPCSRSWHRRALRPTNTLPAHCPPPLQVMLSLNSPPPVRASSLALKGSISLLQDGAACSGFYLAE